MGSPAGVESRIGHSFGRPDLLQRALTHRSFAAQHNERLEFLGDAVLNLAISLLLFDRFADRDEGELTRMRAQLVREDSLHQVALAMGLPEAVRLSEAEARSGGAQRPSILADALEAVVAAVHLDAGFDAALSVVERLFLPLLAAGDLGRSAKDAKTALQELLQSRRQPVPAYRIVATRGQAHAQTFEVECSVPSLGLSTLAEGRSRRAAEQSAAQKLLEQLDAASVPRRV